MSSSIVAVKAELLNQLETLKAGADAAVVQAFSVLEQQYSQLKEELKNSEIVQLSAAAESEKAMTTAMIAITRLKQDLEGEQKKLVREVILRSDTIQELNRASQTVAELQTEKAALEVLKNDADRKYNEVNELNKVLHSRLEALNIKLAEKDRHSSGVSGTTSLSSFDEDGLQNVVEYLRRTKEISEKEKRRNKYEMDNLLALNQRQKMVLQRRTEKAEQATKRLKELIGSRKVSCELPAFGFGSRLGIQELMKAIKLELEVNASVHEVRAYYERQAEETAKLAKEIAELEVEEDVQIMKQGNSRQTMSPGARNLRILPLQNMLFASSSALVSLASHLLEAEESEQAFSGRGRWKQVRLIVETKYIMKYLFNLASALRCQLKDQEVDCSEKDSEIRDLEKLTELQKTDLIRQEELMMLVVQLLDASDSSLKKIRGWRLGSKVRWQQFNKVGRRSKRNSKVDGDFEGLNEPTYLSCCSCSINSACRTIRCQCLVAGSICGPSCACCVKKCCNRGSAGK